MSDWWANAESRRITLGRWEFYRDKRDWGPDGRLLAVTDQGGTG